MSDDVEREISGAAYGRRTFLRRLAIGSAFAVPVVSSFSMAGLQAVGANADQNGPGMYGQNSTIGIYSPNSNQGEPAWQEVFQIIGRAHHS